MLLGAQWTLINGSNYVITREKEVQSRESLHKVPQDFLHPITLES